MSTVNQLQRVARATLIALGAVVLYACSDRAPDPLIGPSPVLRAGGDGQGPDFRAAIAAQERHTDALLRTPGVVGTAVGHLPNGALGVQILVERAGVNVPASLDGVPAAIQVTGRLMALSDPTTRQRPAPLGYSIGHPAITAGTIGARVRDAAGNVYVLSNNHVLANGNDATIGDPEYQPGPFDGGTAADQIATLSAFHAIEFSGTANNLIDAAIAQADPADLGNATPADDGYGAPNTAIYGDADANGTIDDRNALLGVDVHKYGRTTGHTHGTITGVNATVTVCYEVVFIFCVKSARFVDQLIITPGTFSGGGDSGSLIVSDDGNNNPVALLFAGSAEQTIGNRIDHVLNRFGVTIDGSEPPPPTPLNDVAVNNISAPASVTVGNTVTIGVTVRNVGNQDVAAAFDVSLRDATDNVALGTQTVSGLTAGASTTLSFDWNTTGSSIGSHTLVASHTLADDNAANNERSATVSVNAPSVNIHVGDLDAITSGGGGAPWSATVEIAVHDNNHSPLNGVTVRGTWSPAGLASDECVTGDLGGDGTCIVLFPSIRRQTKSVTFTVTSLTSAGHTYQSSANHDPDGSSNGTSIKVIRP